MKSNLKPAVGYVRMSSDRQEASPEQQRQEIERLAKREGYHVLREYYDQAVSGDDTRRRKAFQQMIRDAQEKGDFCAILCWDQDRFGRFDSIEAGRWIHPLREAGVWLHTVAQGRIDWNQFAGRLMYSIQQEGKHQFLVDLSRNVLRGKITSAKQGKGQNGPCFGYDRLFLDEHGTPVRRVTYGEKFTKPKGWTVRFVLAENTNAVELVRWIFQTFVDGDWGVGSIAEDLNRRGVPAPQCKRWSIQTIKRILTNRRYTGANVFGRDRYGKYHCLGDNGEIAEVNGRKPKAKPIITEGVHDRLLDDTTFKRAQDKLLERSQRNLRPRLNNYILSGVLRCGHCGGAMAGRVCRNRKGERRYYMCTIGQTRPGACQCYQIPANAIEEYVLKQIETRLLTDEAIGTIKAAIYRQARTRSTFREETKSLQARITTLDTKIAKGTENLLLAAPRDITDMSTLLGLWREERDKLHEELEALASNPASRTPEQLAEIAIRKLQSLRKQFDTSDPMRVRAVIKSVVAEVRLWFEPYGKRNKRLTRGQLEWRDELQVFSRGCRGR